MRIIGGRDFYDGGLAFGRDEELVFVRERDTQAKAIPGKDTGLISPTTVIAVQGTEANARHSSDAVGNDGLPYKLDTMCVWFAGKRYGGVKVTRESSTLFKSYLPRETFYFWSDAALREFLDRRGISLRDHIEWHAKVLDTSNIAVHFDREAKAEETEWLIRNGVAVAIWQHAPDDISGWRTNTDGLKDIGFMKRVDPYMAFQELSMFVGGVMARPSKPIASVSDDVRAAKHGFDNWSFRRPSVKKAG